MCLFEPNSSFIMRFLTSLKATKISSCNIVNETSYIIANMSVMATRTDRS